MGFYIPWLVDAARMAAAGTGKQVIVAPGWQSRGHGPMRLVEVVVGHHTGTPDTARGDYPSLPVVQNGRAGLAGPLAQYGLGRSGNIYVIAAGLCYHAGVSAYAGYIDLNDEAIGIEAESAGGGGWTPDQLVMYPRLVAACLLYLRRGTDRYASHRTVARPAGRKPDPTGISDDWMRQRATLSPTEEDDMFNDGDRALLQQMARLVHSLAWRVEAIENVRYAVHKDAGPPEAGEDVPVTKMIDGGAWRLHGLVQLADKGAGGPPDVKDQPLPVVALLKTLAADVAELKARRPPT